LEQLPFTAGFWQAHAGYALAIVAVLALLVGSFLNVVILRLPVMMDRAWRRECSQLLATPEADAPDGKVSLAFPPSTCPRCGHRIRAHENIPVLSYIALRGRCANCRGPISIRYPIVELLSAVLCVAVAWRFGAGMAMAAALVFTWSLIALAVIDLDHQLLPDSITQPLLWLGLLVNSRGLLVPLPDALWGAVLGYLSLWLVYWCFKLLTGKDGMGHGDFKLLAALGAWLGWQALPLIILLSSAVGAVIGLLLILVRGRDRNVPMPFGPFLAAAGWLTLLWGEQLGASWRAMATMN